MGETARRSLRRALRYLARLGAAVAILSLLVASAGLGLVLHLNMPAGRRVTARLLSEFLSRTFQGTLTIGEIERITTRGVTARDVVVQDVYGNTVLTASQLRGRADVFEILHDLLLDDSEKVTIVIRHARVENAEANIITDPDDLGADDQRRVHAGPPSVETRRAVHAGTADPRLAAGDRDRSRVRARQDWKQSHAGDQHHRGARLGADHVARRGDRRPALRHGGARSRRNRRRRHRRAAHPGAGRGLGRVRRKPGTAAAQRVHPRRRQPDQHHRRRPARAPEGGPRAVAGLAAARRRHRASRSQRRAADPGDQRPFRDRRRRA